MLNDIMAAQWHFDGCTVLEAWFIVLQVRHTNIAKLSPQAYFPCIASITACSSWMNRDFKTKLCQLPFSLKWTFWALRAVNWVFHQCWCHKPGVIVCRSRMVANWDVYQCYQQYQQQLHHSSYCHLWNWTE